MPGRSIEEAGWGYSYMVGILVFTLAGRAPTARLPEAILGQIAHSEPSSVTIARLQRFICAGLRALGKTAPRGKRPRSPRKSTVKRASSSAQAIRKPRPRPASRGRVRLHER